MSKLLTPDEEQAWIARMSELAAKYYYRFNSVRVDSPNAFVVVSEDQGGWPFDAFTFKIACEPDIARRAFEAALRALTQSPIAR